MEKLLLYPSVILVLLAGCVPMGTDEAAVISSFDANPGSIDSGESSGALVKSATLDIGAGNGVGHPFPGATTI